MDIVVIGSPLVNNQKQEKTAARVSTSKKRIVDRRHNRKDRRKSVREGVVVKLSYPNDRRVRPDRRVNR